MFNEGDKYNVEMLDTRDDNGHPDITSTYRTVISVDGPLVEFSDGKRTVIINTHSPVFVRATAVVEPSGRFAVRMPPMPSSK